MELKKIIINGTSPFSVVIKRIIEQEGGGVLCFTTLQRLIQSNNLDGLPIVAIEDLPKFYSKSNVAIVNTIGYSKMNKLRVIAQQEMDKLGYKTISYVSKMANVYSDQIGVGTIIMPGAFVGPEVKIGMYNIIYSNVSLTHHIHIGNYNFIASGCVLGGNVSIQDNCFIGLNSTIRNRLSIPSFTLIGCGSNLIKSIEDENTVWTGNPAKIIEGKMSINTIIK